MVFNYFAVFRKEAIMANMTNIIVKDDASTPKAWTLIPITDNPIPFWRANDVALPIEGQPRLYASVEKVKSGGYKISAKLEVPVMETLGASGAATGYVAPQKVAYVNSGFVTVIADARSTAADRMNVLRMLIGVCQGATSTVDTGTLANNAAGQTWTGNSAPFLDLFEQLVLPN